MANAIAVCIENLKLEGLVGSVAGDDTMLMVFKNKELSFLAERELKATFGCI